MKQTLHLPISFGIHIFILAIVLSGCSQKQGDYRDIRSYYYPLNELQPGLVYAYREVNNPALVPSYWYIQSLHQDKQWYLSATFYEQNLLPAQQIRERMTPDGMRLEDLYLYGRDTLEGGRQPRSQANIIAPAVFPFHVRPKGGIFLYHVHWQDPVDTNAWYTVIKNRYFEGDTTFSFKGKDYPAIKFAVREHYELDQQGVFETTYLGWEIYAKGLGLVHYRKEIQDGFTLEYRLEERFPMEALEKKFQSLYENKIPPTN